jgi:hypothetical protein
MEANNVTSNKTMSKQSEGRPELIDVKMPNPETSTDQVVFEILAKRAELEFIQYSAELREDGLMSFSATPPVAKEAVAARSKDPIEETVDPGSDANDVKVLKESSKSRHSPTVKPPPDNDRQPGAWHVVGPSGSNQRDASLEVSLAGDTDSLDSSLVGDTDSTQSCPDHQQQNLVEADPVLEDPENRAMMHARPVDLDDVQNKLRQWEKQQRCLYIALIVLFIVGLIVAGCVAGTQPRSHEPQVSTTQEAPEAFLSVAPSEVPFSALDGLFSDLPEGSQGSILKGNTPQYFAWEWLSKHPNITYLPEWRKRQLFALSTFFYAFEGESWNPLIADRWMDYTKDECLWFSSGFGYFEDGKYIEWSMEAHGYSQVEPCNGVGEFIQVNLQDLQMSGLQPFVPPETALLTSLQAVQLYLNDLEAPLPDLFPTELCLMSTLDEIWICTNNVTGYIPSELGLMTNLKVLDINTNSFSGPLPSELVLMTSLQLLDLHNNGLSGRIPDGLWHFSELKMLQLSNIPMLTGLIPTDGPLLSGLRSLNLSGSPGIYGTIPDGWCVLQDPSCSFLTWWGETISCSLEFDCSAMLCGCDCPCSNESDVSIVGGAHHESSSNGT